MRRTRQEYLDVHPYVLVSIAAVRFRKEPEEEEEEEEEEDKKDEGDSEGEDQDNGQNSGYSVRACLSGATQP